MFYVVLAEEAQQFHEKEADIPERFGRLLSFWEEEAADHRSVVVAEGVSPADLADCPVVVAPVDLGNL